MLATNIIFIGSKARIYNPKCPGVCGSFVKPDCNGLCHGLGFSGGGYCTKEDTCCCLIKSSGPVDVPTTAWLLFFFLMSFIL